MPNFPLVSVLIPCHNAELWLAETLKSVLEQTWPNTEIIVVDDGSTDSSLTVAKTYESQNVKVISQANQGASAARNQALQHAQGDFIQYLDADDLLAPDKVEKQIILLQKNESGCIASGEWARFYRTPAEAQFIAQPLWVDLSPVDWLLTAWERQYMMHPAAWLVPRSITEQAGIWNENLTLNDDGEYFWRVVLASREVKFCPGARSYYRSGNGTSLSGSKSYQAWKSAALSMDLGTSRLLAVENSHRTRQACANLLQSLIYTIYPDAPDLIEPLEENVNSLGGSNFPLPGGATTRLVSCVLGWRRAKLLQQWVYHQGYQKLAFGWRFAKMIQKLTYQFLKLQPNLPEVNR